MWAHTSTGEEPVKQAKYDGSGAFGGTEHHPDERAREEATWDHHWEQVKAENRQRTARTVERTPFVCCKVWQNAAKQ